MGLVLSYIERTPAGSFQYRRRVPKEILAIIGKTMFKKKLGDSRKEALAAYPRYHGQVEREIAEAHKRLARASGLSLDDLSDRDAYAEALRRRADLIAAGATEEELIHEGESIADSFPQDDWTPQDVPSVDRHTINLLRLGPERYAPPAATLTDAQRLYVKEKLGGEGDATFDSRTNTRISRVIGMVVEALGRDPLLSSLSREDARRVRDHMLGRVKSTGEKVAPASVRRDLNAIKAVVNFGAKEFDLPATFQSPFNKLSLGAVDRAGGRDSASQKRDPIPEPILRKMRQRLQDHAKPDLVLIWRMLAGTGCRLAEVAGLRGEDVSVAGELPFVRIVDHEGRRLKTEASRRDVPLVGDALEAAKEALQRPREGSLIFPSYGRDRGPDAASAALMKHLRAVTADKKLTVHSLRHTMKDRLILAGVSPQIQDMVLGHASSGVGDRVYGGARAKLEAATAALKAALLLAETTSDAAS